MRIEEVIAHVPPQVTVGDDASQQPAPIQDSDTAESLGGHLKNGVRHAGAEWHKRHRRAGVHDIAHGLEQRAELSAGVKETESDRVKPWLSRSAIASASPRASCMSDDVVGARLCGQASRACGNTRATSAILARALSAMAVIAISLML